MPPGWPADTGAASSMTLLLASAAAAHTSHPPAQAGQELDEILTVLANKYSSTVFLRLPLAGSQLPQLLSVPPQDGAVLTIS